MSEPNAGSQVTMGGNRRGWMVAAGAGALAVAVAVVAVVASRPEEVTVTIPEGARVVAALDRSLSTESAEVGDEVKLTTREAIALEGDVSIPAGQRLVAEVTHSKGGGRIAGAPELTLRVRSIEIDGQTHEMAATPFRFKGKNDALESAVAVAGGAVAGAVVGEVLTDKAIEGAVVGAAAGAAVAVATKGDQIVLPAGARLRVRFTQPVTVTFRPADPEAADGGKDRDG